MPDLDGMAMLERIRAQRHLADVPVVMITADTSVKLRVAALESGCTDFLTKPIIVPELLAQTQNLLRLRLGQRMMRDQAAVPRSRLAEAAPMHDIGKIGIPDAILLKPGRLTDSEMRVMPEHPVIGPSSARLRRSRLATTRSTTALAIPRACGGRRFRWPAASSPSPTSSTR